jgi:hypothetical protein
MPRTNSDPLPFVSLAAFASRAFVMEYPCSGPRTSLYVIVRLTCSYRSMGAMMIGYHDVTLLMIGCLSGYAAVAVDLRRTDCNRHW